MSELSYSHAAFPVRDDLLAAHRRAWRRLATPGYWWTAAERIAIATEVRNAWQCTLCIERKAALSPYTVVGEHERVSELSDAALDVIHRVTTDPGRLTKDWYERSLGSGQLSDGQYVEIIDVLVGVVSIDSFCYGIDVPVHPFPTPQPGQPSHHRPASAVLDVGWVAMIPDGGDIGPEAGLYGQTGGSAHVLRALSLVPDAVRQLIDLSTAHYLHIEQIMDFTSRRAISRSQIELIAGRVSALRGCFY